ncbi:hypothetical protein A2U01_0025987, partial [Trifolium medium]|nr:hypothetical protein [Trifolium medium]
FIDLEDSGKKSIVYSRRYSSNKRKDEEKEMVIPTSSGVPIKRKDKGKDVVNLANSEPIKMKDKRKDTVISASSMFMDTSKEAGNSTSNKRKDIGEEHDIPSSSTPISRVSNTR